jgi:hypothetical protein
MTTATRNSKRREELSSRKTGSRRSPRRGRRAAATGPASRLESPGERRNRNGMGKRRSWTHKSQRHNSTKLAACARKTQKQIQRSSLSHVKTSTDKKTVDGTHRNNRAVDSNFEKGKKKLSAPALYPAGCIHDFCGRIS